MPIIDTVKGYSIEVGDFVILDSEEVEIRHLDDEGEMIVVEYYSHSTGDLDETLIDPDGNYEIWGE